MTANNAQTNTFVQGMDMDTDVSLLQNSKYRYAENIRVVTNNDGTSGAIQNIDDIKQYDIDFHTYFGKDEKVLGAITINQYAIVLTSIMIESTTSSGIPMFVSGTAIYRIENFDQPNPTLVNVFKGVLGISTEDDKNISMVADYESDNVIKLYFTDGHSPLKVINIMSDKYQGVEWTDSSILDITPGASLPPLQILGLGVGSLPTGVVQYGYQLFNMQGAESVISSLTETIHIVQSDTSQNMMNYKGSNSNENSGKSCILYAYVPTSTKFDKIRVIRIQYLSNNDAPVIYIIDEISTNNDGRISYTDTGTSIIGEMSLDEFNNLSSYQFVGSSIEKLQNRLFVANVTEDTWDIEDYDARAYRCNADGKLVLQSTNSSNTITINNMDDIDFSSIPEDHDCINPYNTLNLSQQSLTDKSQFYIYSNTKDSQGNRIPGGTGPNIDYTFIYTELKLTDGDNNERIYQTTSMNCIPVNRNYLVIHEVGTDDTSREILQDSSNTPTRQFNYSDPYIAANYKSYQRDEVYRFGIIFYNKKSIPSPVYWIGDIRMFHSGQYVEPFTRNEGDFGITDYTDGTGGNQQHYALVAKPLGIKFTIKNFPEGAIGYEIVRCDRTESDRTVIMQGMLNNIYEYRLSDEGGDIIGQGHSDSGMEGTSSIETRPYTIPEYWSRNLAQSEYIYMYNASRSDSDRRTCKLLRGSSAIDNYVKFVSPEVCLQQEDAVTYFNGSTYLDPIGSYFSAVIVNDGYGVSQTNLRTLQSDGSITSVDYQDEFTRTADGYVEWRPASNTYDIASIFKYHICNYYIQNNAAIGNTQATVRNAAYPPIIPYNQVQNGSPYRINIGDRTYLNWAMPCNIANRVSTSDWGRYVSDPGFMGPAGPCVVLQVDNMRTVYPEASTIVSKLYTGLDVREQVSVIGVVNLKRNNTNQYGGNTYAARQNSVYISTNSYKQISSTLKQDTVNVFGGDTFMGLLDYPQMFTFQMPTEDDFNFNRRYVGCYIPFESSINMNLFQGDMPHMSYTSDGYLDSHLHMDPQQTQTYHSQDLPFFLYNTVYSSQNGSRNFVPKGIYSESHMHIPSRIMVSQAKTANAILDNWTVFKAADYLDVGSQYGSITNLKAFKDRLFFFQDTAVGIASVNERSLITDNNVGTLLLGTGGILTRYDYITTLNGTSITNDKSIMNSDNVLYWYDYNKNEICAFDNTVHSLSKEKNMQSYLNSNKGNQYNITAFYDKKYNEAWFSFHDKSLIFNEQLGCFTSFYTFNPDYALVFSNRIASIKDSKIYTINDETIEGLEVLDKNAEIRFIVNQNYTNTKVYDNILFDGQLLDANNNNLSTELIDYMKFNTKGQEAELNNPTFDYREDTYRLPIPRQTIKDSDSYAARLRGKYLECEYHFNTEDGKTFKIPYINTTYRYSLV